MFQFLRPSIAGVGASLVCVCALGCGSNSISTAVRTGAAPLATPGAIRGAVHGGNSPITGATIQLYVAGQSATGATGASGGTAGTPGTYGTGYSGLITPGTGGTVTAVGANPYPVFSDANGNFSITGDYNCPATTPDSMVYLVSSGGNPGLAAGTNNLTAVNIAALGSCTALKANAANTFVSMNEVTTTAAVVALQQFMSASFGTANVAGSGGTGTDGTINFGIGAPSTNIVGLQNAFATAQVLANVATGSSPGTSSIATVESAKINTIADILSVCVNSTGSNNATCAALEAAATPSGSNTAADTVQIALYLAQNPANNVANLYSYASSTPPFAALAVAPTDWTVAVQYAPQNGGTNAIGAAFGVAADKYGNVWLSQAGNGTTPAASVIEVGPTGTLLTAPVTSFTVSTTQALAPDLTATPAGGTVTIATPKGVVVDSSNNAWVGNGSYIAVTTTTSSTAPTNSANSVAAGLAVTRIGTLAELSGSTAAGVPGAATVSGFYGAPTPYSAIADGNGNVYFTSADNTSSNALSKVAMGINNSTFVYSQSNSGAGTNTQVGTNAYGIALDQNRTYSTGPNLFALGGGSCAPYGSLAEIQTGATVPLSVATSTLSPISFGSSGSTSGYYNATNSNLYCGSTIRQRFTSPVQVMYGVAADANSNLWITNNATSAYSTTTTNGGTIASTMYTDSTYNAMTYLTQTLSTARIGTTSTGSTSTNFANLSAPTFVAVDGANHAWVINSQTLTTGGATGNCSTATPCYSINEFSVTNPSSSPTLNTLSGTYGFAHTFASPANLAIDLSGNIWVTNNSATANYVTMIVGAAAPTLPPAFAVGQNLIGVKP